jgi:hypothetical protein
LRLCCPRPRGSNVALGARLAQAAADVLRQIITVQDVVGPAWSEPLTALGRYLPRLPRCPLVQLTTISIMDPLAEERFRDPTHAWNGPHYAMRSPLVLAQHTSPSTGLYQSDTLVTGLWWPGSPSPWSPSLPGSRLVTPVPGAHQHAAPTPVRRGSSVRVVREPLRLRRPTHLFAEGGGPDRGHGYDPAEEQAKGAPQRFPPSPPARFTPPTADRPVPGAAPTTPHQPGSRRNNHQRKAARTADQP